MLDCAIIPSVVVIDNNVTNHSDAVRNPG